MRVPVVLAPSEGLHSIPSRVTRVESPMKIVEMPLMRVASSSRLTEPPLASGVKREEVVGRAAKRSPTTRLDAQEEIFMAVLTVEEELNESKEYS